MKHPLSARQVHTLLLVILDDQENGEVVLTAHAIKRMAERGMDMAELLSVLRNGWVYAPAEESKQGWAYKVERHEDTVVVSFPDDDKTTVVVTLWWR